jgi:Putative beta-barrel porin-2, OmpL-like. bbp2
MRPWIACACTWLWMSFLAAAPAHAQQTVDLNNLTGENQAPLQITGFGVVDGQANGRTGDNSFDAGKLAVAMFRELNQNVWVFGQLTTSVSPPADPAAGDVSTDIEIDNLIVNLTPPKWSAFSLSAGKFDTPLGFERDDEPLNLQATNSYNFDLARPTKMVGVIGRYTATPRMDVAAWIANGWQSDLEPNHGKTVGGRVGIRPTEQSSVGAGFLYGPEGLPGATQKRYLASFDYAFEPTNGWIVGGEANIGGDRANGPLAATKWYGATASAFRRFGQNFGTTVRAEVFNDHNGARTGVPQTLTSFTIAPMYFLGVGGEGIFATIEHTTFRIPRFQLRGEIRFDRSTANTFVTSNGNSNWTVHYIAQIVTTF